MPTKVIGFSDRVLNVFTKFGRQRNYLFKELNKNGYSYITERKLPNNSRVILGYKNESSKQARYAFKVNPDLTMEQKRIDKKFMLNGLGDRYLHIEKIWTDKSGKKVAEHIRDIKTRNKKVVGTHSYIVDYSKDATVKYDKECVNMVHGFSSNQVSKIFKKTSMTKPKTYQFMQYTDGTRDYSKFADGIEYKFSTKR